MIHQSAPAANHSAQVPTLLRGDRRPRSGQRRGREVRSLEVAKRLLIITSLQQENIGPCKWEGTCTVQTIADTGFLAVQGEGTSGTPTAKSLLQTAFLTGKFPMFPLPLYPLSLYYQWITERCSLVSMDPPSEVEMRSLPLC